jgi:hypothetical protein
MRFDPPAAGTLRANRGRQAATVIAVNLVAMLSAVLLDVLPQPRTGGGRWAVTWTSTPPSWRGTQELISAVLARPELLAVPVAPDTVLSVFPCGSNLSDPSSERPATWPASIRPVTRIRRYIREGDRYRDNAASYLGL